MVGRNGALEITHQLGELLGEIVRRQRAAIALQGIGRTLVAAGRPAEAEVDAPRMHAGEHAEALGDLEGAVMGKHHPSAADPHPRGRLGDRADEHFRARASEHRARMMFREPIAMKAEAVGELCEVERVAQRVAPTRPLRDRRLIENAEAKG